MGKAITFIDVDRERDTGDKPRLRCSPARANASICMGVIGGRSVRVMHA